jgi:hypothetical protein
MIDAATGAIPLDDTTIGPTTTLAALRRSPLGEALEKRPAGVPPWETWSAGVRVVGGRRVAVSMTFEKERLEIVSLSLRDEAESAPWEDWSEKRERRRKTKHDAWLEKTLGAPARDDDVGVYYDYAWGRVLSTFDPRSGSSDIVVTYG